MKKIRTFSAFPSVLFILIFFVFSCGPSVHREDTDFFFPHNTDKPSFSAPPIPSSPSPISSLKPVSKLPLIVIDAGHGGKDLGTESVKPPKYQEKSFNLTTAMMVRKYLQQLGYHTLMTRKEDVFISLQQRSQFANHAQSQVFVSVHFNSAPDSSAEGIEVFYFLSDTEKTRSQLSKKLAQDILSRVIQNTQAKSRGVKHGNLSVIRETTMPAILIEGGFLTNPKEREKIRDKEYLKKIAQGIAKGIDDYIKRGLTDSNESLVKSQKKS